MFDSVTIFVTRGNKMDALFINTLFLVQYRKIVIFVIRSVTSLVSLVSSHDVYVPTEPPLLLRSYFAVLDT